MSLLSSIQFVRCDTCPAIGEVKREPTDQHRGREIAKPTGWTEVLNERCLSGLLEASHFCPTCVASWGPCPFCWKASLTFTAGPRRDEVRMHCNECGADGPSAESVVEARQKWGTR